MQTPRRGITLIEVLVVVSILGALLALLLPAVNSVRENARRAQCQNNLRQIALAVQHFESSRHKYPSLWNGSFLPQPTQALDEFHFHSWRSAILAELEEMAVLQSLDMKLPATDPANQPAVNQKLAVFLCPSTTNKTAKVPDILPYGNVFSDQKLPLGTAARSDYEAIGGVRVTVVKPSHEILGDTKFGVWGEPHYKPGTSDSISYRTTRASDLKDGLSKTLLVAERGGRPDIYENGQFTMSYPFPPDKGADIAQAAWAISTHFAWLVFHDQQTVNASNSTGIYGFHPKGAHAAMADGSTHFLSDTTDPKILSAMATRAGAD